MCQSKTEKRPGKFSLNARDCGWKWNLFNIFASAGGAFFDWIRPFSDIHCSMLYFAFFCWAISVNIDQLIRKTTPKAEYDRMIGQTND